MPTIAQVDGQGTTTTSAELTFAFASTPGSGSLLLFWMAARSAGGAVTWDAFGGGLSWLEGPTDFNGDASGGWVQGAGDGSTNAFVFNAVGASHKYVSVGYEITGHNMSTPIRGSSPVATGSSASASPASEGVVGGDLVLAGVHGVGGSAGVTAWDGDFVTDDTFDSTSTSGARLIATGGSDVITADGTTDPTATLAGSVVWAMSTVVIAPAVSATSYAGGLLVSNFSLLTPQRTLLLSERKA